MKIEKLISSIEKKIEKIQREIDKGGPFYELDCQKRTYEEIIDKLYDLDLHHN